MELPAVPPISNVFNCRFHKRQQVAAAIRRETELPIIILTPQHLLGVPATSNAHQMQPTLFPPLSLHVPKSFGNEEKPKKK